MLRLLQLQLEAVYQTAAPNIVDFILADDQLTEVLGEHHREADEWVLVRDTRDGVDLGVWVAERHRTALLNVADVPNAIDQAFPAYCAAIEGVSHFLMLIERARRGEPVRQLELEVQAEIDKFICARLHAPTRNREWLQRLFRAVRLADDLTPEERDRYKEAGRLAEALCRHLDRHPHDEARIRDLRRFWRSSGQQRLDRMRRLAA